MGLNLFVSVLQCPSVDEFNPFCLVRLRSCWFHSAHVVMNRFACPMSF